MQSPRLQPGCDGPYGQVGEPFGEAGGRDAAAEADTG